MEWTAEPSGNSFLYGKLARGVRQLHRGGGALEKYHCAQVIVQNRLEPGLSPSEDYQ